jgi:beta-lactamase class A
MSVSDNAATNIIYERVGRPAIDAVLDDLGLHRTVVRGDMTYGVGTVVAELGLTDGTDLDAQLAQADEAVVWALSLIDPGRANASTPREIGDLLEAIWTDRAGPPDACALVRSLMSHQVTAHRLASGFPANDVVVAGKTGTLPAVRNEAGVISYPDGRRFVAAIFTRAETLTDRQPAIDTAIGSAAALAVEHLRSTSQGENDAR